MVASLALESPLRPTGANQIVLAELQTLLSHTDTGNDGEDSNVIGHDCSTHTDESESPTEDLTEDICFFIKSLMELTPTIEICLDRASKSSVVGKDIEPFAVSMPAGFYVRLIRERYKHAPSELIGRLGEANWERYNRLRDLEQLSGPDANPTTAEQKAPSIKAPQTQSQFRDSGLGTMDSASTKYAASVRSHSSLISSEAEPETGYLRVPSAPPEVAEGTPFCCPYCGEIQYSITNRVAWK